MISRRSLLLGGSALLGVRADAGVRYPDVLPGRLTFPRDFGAHPEFRIEWWYVTGWLDGQPALHPPLGFQVTFFRARTGVDPANPSAFAAHQLILAHVALADPAQGALLHDQRLDRAGFGVAEARSGDTDVRIGDWYLRRDPATDRYHAHVTLPGCALTLDAAPVGPPLLQGDAGYSRKGPEPGQASRYYSRPQLRVAADLRRTGATGARTGTGWLDHEWSSSPLAPGAAGWDWTGMNLADGGALTAFQIRSEDPGDRPLYAYACLQRADGQARTFGPDAVRFGPAVWWSSPETGARWPVAQRITVGPRTFETRPLFHDQELDSRRSTGAVYWEGASHLLEKGREIGRGYLELTGYLEPLRL